MKTIYNMTRVLFIVLLVLFDSQSDLWADNDPTFEYLEKWEKIISPPLVMLPNSTIVWWAGREEYLEKSLELHLSAEEFHLLAIKSYIISKNCLVSNNILLARKYRDKMIKYNDLAILLNSDAISLYNDTIDIAKSEVIYNAAMYMLGATTLSLGPVAYAIYEVAEFGTDYYLDISLGSQEDANYNLASKAVTKVLVEMLAGPAGDVITKHIGQSGKYEYLIDLIGSSEFKTKAIKYLMSVTGRISRKASEEAIEQVSSFLIDTMFKPTKSGNPENNSISISGHLCPVTPDLSSNQADNINSSNNYSSAIIIDSSGSMKEIIKNPDNSQAVKLLKAKQAAKAFILAMNEADQVSISTFSDGGNTQQNMAPVSQVKQVLDQALSQIKPSGATNIGAGLEQGFQQLGNSEAGSLKTALLLSDGKNNRGDWKPVVSKYTEKGWSICTIGFGKDADEKALRKIAEDTGCTYARAETFDVVVKYQQLGAFVKGHSLLLATSDLLTINGTLIYEFVVSQDSKLASVNTSWQGSLLKTVLISPDGRRINAEQLAQGMGRYVQGDTFQLLEISAPQPGRWKIETSWAVPPPIPEQVNILVTEKSDVFSRILSFRPQYSIGEPVIINVEVKELIGNRKTPANQASVNVKIKKPGAQMIRMVQAQSTNWTMYKDVVVDVTRELELFDDGMHDDYKSGDGIFGNSFRETDKQGAYLVTATVNGQMRNGQSFEKSTLASLQVGPITQNKVTTSQTLQYVSEASYHIDNTSPYAKEIFNQPMEEINDMQGLDMLDGIDMQGEDPLDSIEEMMNAQ